MYNQQLGEHLEAQYKHLGVEEDMQMYNIIASCIYHSECAIICAVYSSVECSQLQWMLDDHK